MKYILYHDAKWGRRITELTQAKNMSEAIKEALVAKVCDYWDFSFDDKKQPIDFNNFDTWLIDWLKNTRYWDIPAINENAQKNRRYYGTLKEAVLVHLKLFQWRRDDMIYEINDEKNISEDLYKIKDNIVGVAISKEIEQMEIDSEKKEYERLKKKFEAKECKNNT
jgi:hypothetical protein